MIAIIAVFAFGCGGSGKSQKISGVADEESQVMDEAKASAKEALPTTYMVEEGDTLWKIAGKPEIYGNQKQWPLIYDANRDILDDYKKPLEEGVKLIIPRNVSAIEIAAAKQKAEEYGMPPGTGKKTVSTEDYEEEQDNVAGMGSAVVKPKKAASADESQDSEYMEEEAPTPIPEPVNAKKKGKSNNMLIILALVGVILLIIIFIVSKQKKKEEEEDTKEDSGTKTNILD